jgi:hypothetical protein
MDAMKTVSMKLSKSQKKRMFGASPVGSSSSPDYPWGLSLTLDSAALKKLGVEELPEAGEECMIHATGKVTTVSETANEKGGERRVDVQITKLALVYKDTDEELWNKVKADRKAAA